MLFSLVAAQSYSTAVVDNKVNLDIVNPHGPIFIEKGSDLLITQGQSLTNALVIGNNMTVPVNCKLVYAGSDFWLDPALAAIPPDGSQAIELHADNLSPVGPQTLELALEANFAGGRALLKTTLQFEVIEGVLELFVEKSENESEAILSVLWNDEEAPPGTEYRVRGPESEWSRWKPFASGEAVHSLDAEGIYDFEARLGETYSNIVDLFYEPAIPEPYEPKPEVVKRDNEDFLDKTYLEMTRTVSDGTEEEAD